MNTLFIPAKSKLSLDEIDLDKVSKELPKDLVIGYSIQYKELADKIKNILSKKHNITKFIQILGCSMPSLPKTKAILLISDGKFHATSLAYETKLPVFLLNRTLEKISKKDIETLEKKQKASYVKFLNARKVGVIVSTKPGQENIKRALKFKKETKNKRAYLFLANNIDAAEFENFGLDSWINTSCPRLDMNTNSIINLNKL